MQSGAFVRNDLGHIVKLTAVAVPAILSTEVAVVVGITVLAVFGVFSIGKWLFDDAPATEKN